MTTAHETLPLGLSVPITAHCFNKTRDAVAVCPNSHQVHIYQRNGSEWKCAHVLSGHDKLVTSIDWAPNTNRIVTCSQDRNAYVWTWDATVSEWKPTLVLLSINRAATFVKWAPLENKFALASGARCIAVCYFEKDNDWWVSKHIKKPIRSTVLSIDWHPNNVLLAASSTDMKARVFSGFIKELDQKPGANPWGEKLPFGTLCAEYLSQNGGWIHDVAFSPDGNYLAWISHDASVYVADPAARSVQVVRTNLLPLMSILWASSNNIVAVGHDCTPILFSNNNGSWSFVDKLDQGQQKKSGISNSTAFNKFKQLDNRAQAEQITTELNTVHQNTITSIHLYDGTHDKIAQVSTSGVDGKLVLWNLKTLEESFVTLKL